MSDGNERDRLEVDDEIAVASTLPADVHRDARWFERARERVLARSWQLAPRAFGAGPAAPGAGEACPWSLLEGCLDEPLVETRDETGTRHVLSNVCTHRGNLLACGPGPSAGLRCRYHGRRFGLDGRFLSMPEFGGARGFPAPSDDLPRVAHGEWEGFLFASIDPAFGLDELLAPMRERLSWLPVRDFTFDPGSVRRFELAASWALYCDNYLEGFHVPFVHGSLNKALDYGSYRTELFTYSNLQVGIAASGEDAFELPPSSPDHGQKVAAYYFWLFPNLMFNFYPWGLSLNVVTPLAPDRTRVTFASWVRDPSKLGRGAGAGLDQVEREDEEVVEAVQRGVRSRLYRRGRFSPSREAGVHHFHRLLARFL